MKIADLPAKELSPHLLEGEQLDWAVEKALGEDWQWMDHIGLFGSVDPDDSVAIDVMPSPSTDPDAFAMATRNLRFAVAHAEMRGTFQALAGMEPMDGDDHSWVALFEVRDQEGRMQPCRAFGRTLQIAVCRALVLSRLGWIVQVPVIPERF